jgi:hypothetical protein
MKKSQVTIYIIIGIIVLIVFLSMFWLAKQYGIMKGEGITGRDLNLVETYVKDCITFVGQYDLYLLGLQGGYTTFPSNNFFSDEQIKTGYAYQNNQNTLAEIYEMEQQLSNYMNTNLPNCINLYFLKEKHNLDVELEEPITKVTIGREDILFTVEWPIEISKGSTKTEISEPFKRIIPLRLSYLHDLAEGFVQEKINTGRVLCLDCMGDKHISVTALPYEDSTLFVIKDSKNLIEAKPFESKPYDFMFVMSD